jgi:hypothetical protein
MHRRTDPACRRFAGTPSHRLARWWFDRARGRRCTECAHRD